MPINDKILLAIADEVLPGADLTKISEDDIAKGVRERTGGQEYSQKMTVLSQVIRKKLLLNEEETRQLIRKLISLAIQN